MKEAAEIHAMSVAFTTKMDCFTYNKKRKDCHRRNKIAVIMSEGISIEKKLVFHKGIFFSFLSNLFEIGNFRKILLRVD